MLRGRFSNMIATANSFAYSDTKKSSDSRQTSQLALSTETASPFLTASPACHLTTQQHNYLARETMLSCLFPLLHSSVFQLLLTHL